MDITQQNTLDFVLWVLGFIKTNQPLKPQDELDIPYDKEIVKHYEQEKDLPNNVVIHHLACWGNSALRLSMPDKDGVYHPLANIEVRVPTCDECCQMCLLDVFLYSHETGKYVNHTIHFEEACGSCFLTSVIYDIGQKQLAGSFHEYIFHEDTDFKQVIPVNGPVDVAWVTA